MDINFRSSKTRIKIPGLQNRTSFVSPELRRQQEQCLDDDQHRNDDRYLQQDFLALAARQEQHGHNGQQRRHGDHFLVDAAVAQNKHAVAVDDGV